MERTTSDTASGPDVPLDPSFTGRTDSVAGLGLNILPPSDFRHDARFVTARMAVLRRPPELALAAAALSARSPQQDKLGEGEPPAPGILPTWPRIVAQGFATDLERLASLDPDLMAWRVTEMSARLADRPDLVSRPEALPGLRVLNFQALLFEHLQILKSAVAEGTQ
jgi:hypothetical protein